MQKLIDAGASLNIPDAVRTYIYIIIHAYMHFYIMHNKYFISYFSLQWSFILDGNNYSLIGS